MNKRKETLDLFLVSVLGLFLELMMIRWIGSEMRLFAFYRNFALIAAFLGLGIGFALQHREGADDWFENVFFKALALIAFMVIVLGRTQLNEVILLNHPNPQEYVWAQYTRADLRWAATLAFYTALFVMSLLIAIAFIPLGQLTARKFAAFRPLPGYTINILGSLTGIVLYTLVSWLSWSPPVWFLIVGIASLYFLPRDNWRRLAVSGGLALIPVLLTLFWPTGAERTIWSPYYRIGLSPAYAENDPAVQLGFDLTVNQEWHQALLNFDPSFVENNYDAAPQHFDTELIDYDTPFSVAPRLDDVLIVGAGTGNDVAAALRAGSKRVVAVEIDPMILRLGRNLHPEAPYSDPRVEVINQDARSYFRSSTETFDLILFGRLDSQTLFSTASSVRLDNFVYTQEALTETRNLLADDGLLALSFRINTVWVGERLYRTLTDVFGYAPQVYTLPTGHTLFAVTRQPMTGPIVDDVNIPGQMVEYRDDLPVATDDWPYLYLRSRSIPTPYLIGLIGIVAIGAVLVRYTLPDFRQFNGHFFFMGAAFFLLETKSITELALLLGSTWLVNAAVIAAILLMIVLANLLVDRFEPTNPVLYYAALALALAFNFFVPISQLLALPLLWRIVLASLAQAVPLFFAGVIFAITFRQTDSIEIALGSNLIGSVLGGVIEYTSLALGIRSLYLIALGFYALSFWILQRTGGSGAISFGRSDG